MLGSIENDLEGLSDWEQQSAGFGEGDNLFSDESLAAAEKAATARRTKAPTM